jgi:hypothetical protein
LVSSRGNISRGVCILGLITLGAGMSGRAFARGDELLARRPDRLLIESSQRVSDGRKLQKDAETSFRRAEGGAGIEGGQQGKAEDRTGEGSTGTRASAERSTAAESGADR